MNEERDRVIKETLNQESRTDAGVTMTRRGLFRSTFAVATAAAISNVPASAREAGQATRSGAHNNTVSVTVTINDVVHRLDVRSDVTLLDLLREQLQLTGTKKGCNRGECGACTVMLDERRVNACFVFAAVLDGRRVTTIEGVASPDTLHPVQKAFIACDAFQCGFCTSGQIMSAIGCIKEGHTRSNDEIREWMSGNLCRCSAYPQIAAAVEMAAVELQGGKHGTL